MKYVITFSILFFSLFHFNADAQTRYGKTLNMGLGVGGYSGYYKYVGGSLPVFYIDYEFDVAKNFTLAPFASFYTYTDNYYWGNNNNPDRYYSYHEVVVPIGVKGAYYFDDLFQATSKWDFYAAGSLGFTLVSSRWDDGYPGDKNHYHGGSPLILNLHFGAEYHFNNRLGAFLDLSTGVSTIGLAIHSTK